MKKHSSVSPDHRRRQLRIAGFAAAIILLSAGCRLTPRVDKESPPTHSSPPAISPAPIPEAGRQSEVRRFPQVVPSTVPTDEETSLDEISQVGAAARALLQPGPYRELVVEIDWVLDYPPDPSAVEHLVTVLRSSIRKPVSVRGGNELSRQSGPYYPSQIRALAEARNHSSSGSVAAIWIAYLDGRLAANRRAAGAAISGTVMAIFPDRLRESGSVGAGLESAILVHEMGHLLGLINIGYTSPRTREDPKYPGHSINRGSVMHWSVEAASGSDGLPTTFDEDDLADLRGLADGSL